jgi:hypothetical protein
MSSGVTALPERIGRYDVVLPLRTDDRGAAWLARASGLGGFDRFVVIEIAAKAFQERKDFSKLVIDEATRIANLRHTNVVPVYDVGEDEAGVFLVTEYVPGTSLAELKSAPPGHEPRRAEERAEGRRAQDPGRRAARPPRGARARGRRRAIVQSGPRRSCTVEHRRRDRRHRADR